MMKMATGEGSPLRQGAGTGSREVFGGYRGLLGNVACNFKKIPMLMQDLSRRCIATRGESVSIYPRRPKAEAFSNAVDVVERLRDPTDQVPNTRHLHDLHTFNSATSLEL